MPNVCARNPQIAPSPFPQSNTGLRVLRLRGGNGLSIRSVRAAAEMLRRNTCLLELDLSNSSFVTADDSAAAI